MKRTIKVKAGSVNIIATINTKNERLTMNELDRVRDILADRIQEAAASLPYIGIARNRVQVT